MPQNARDVRTPGQPSDTQPGKRIFDPKGGRAGSMRMFRNPRTSLLRLLLEPWGPEVGASEDGIRFQYFTVPMLIGLPVLLGFGLVHLIRGDLIPSTWDLVLICVIVGGWFFYRRTGRWRTVFRATFFLLFAFFLYLLAAGGDEGSRSLWVFILPLITLMNLGRREGLAWTAGCFLASAAIMAAAGRIELVYVYSVGFKVRFLTVLLIASFLSVWYEFSREKYRDGMAEKQARLREEIDERVRLEKDRERIIADLQEALDEVRTLGGLLPICANCHSIRDDSGYWNRLEKFIQDRSDAQFSHDICPKCAETLSME